MAKQEKILTELLIAKFGSQEQYNTHKTELPDNAISLVEMDVAEKSYVDQAIAQAGSTADGKYLTAAALTPYLTKEDATATYQPKGEFALKTDIAEFITGTVANGKYVAKATLDDYVTKAKADTLYQPKGEYALKTELSSYVTNEALEGKNLASKDDLSAYATTADVAQKMGQVDFNSLQNKPDMSTYETMAHAEATYQPKGEYVTNEALTGKGFLDTAALQKYLKDNHYTTAPAEGEPGPVVHWSSIQDVPAYLLKTDAAEAYAPKAQQETNTGDIKKLQDKFGNYALSSALESAKTELTQKITEAVEAAKAAYQPKGKYVTEDALGTKGFETTTHAEATYQKKADMNTFVTEDVLESKHYLTEHQSLDACAKKDTVAQTYLSKTDAEATYQKKGEYALKSELPDVSHFVTEEALEGKNYLTEHQDLSAYETSTHAASTYATKEELSQHQSGTIVKMWTYDA